MRKPVIALTTGRYLCGSNNTMMIACGEDYFSAVLRSGGIPLPIPAFDDRESVETLMDRADGLLLTGGSDIHSKHFKKELHPNAKPIDPKRDFSDLESARIALDRGIPVFGICRGCQVLNVALGGTLIQDIPTQTDTDIVHQTQEKSLKNGHRIKIKENSLLADIMGCKETMVNTRHHQAVLELGKGLKTAAHADDGITEGIESSEDKPLIGLQCHPENLAEEHPRFQNLFDWLIGKAELYRSGK